MLSSVFKVFTLPEAMVPAIGACTKGAHIQLRFLAVFLAILNDMGSIQNFPEKGLCPQYPGIAAIHVWLGASTSLRPAKHGLWATAAATTHGQ